MKRNVADLYGLSPQYEESLRSLCQKPRKLVDQYILDLICLLYFDADSNTVDARFHQDFLILVAGDS